MHDARWVGVGMRSGGGESGADGEHVAEAALVDD